MVSNKKTFFQAPPFPITIKDLQHVLEIGGVETASSMSLISSTGQITSGFLSVDHVIDLLTPDFVTNNNFKSLRYEILF